MNTPDVDTIRARANAASPAPWTARSYDGGYRVADASGNDITGNIDYEVGGVPNEADAEFIAHARTDVPVLLAEVDRLAVERDAMRQVVDAAAPLIVGAKDSTAPRTDVFQRLIDVWDAYTAARAGLVEVPPTPTTDAEFEALPRLDLAERLDPDEARATLADNGIDGPDQPYNPRALAAMRTADRLLAEVERLTAELARAEDAVVRFSQRAFAAESERNQLRAAYRDLAERTEREHLRLEAERAELRRTSQQSIDARDRLLREATAERAQLRAAYRDLAESTEREHRRLEAERADAICDFVLANDRAGELETELELMRHSRDRYQAVVERVRAYLSLLESEAADEQDGDDWSIGTYHAYGRVRRELADALSAAETPREVDVVIRDGQPRVWPAIPEPGPEVTAVRDCDGDVWLREDDHWRIRHGNRTGAWSDVAAYAPLTDASEATPADPAVVAPLCSRCSSNPVAKPGERNADGMPGTPSLRARFCAECIDRCHESTDFAHECAICADPTERGEVTP